MDRKTGGKSCLIGFVLLVASHWTGSFAWIARLLGYIGIANGTAVLQQDGNVWMHRANVYSTIAVGVFAVLEIVSLTGLVQVGRQIDLLLSCVFALVCAACTLMGLFTRKKEEHQ